MGRGVGEQVAAAWPPPGGNRDGQRGDRLADLAGGVLGDVPQQPGDDANRIDRVCLRRRPGEETDRIGYEAVVGGQRLRGGGVDAEVEATGGGDGDAGRQDESSADEDRDPGSRPVDGGGDGG